MTGKPRPCGRLARGCFPALLGAFDVCRRVQAAGPFFPCRLERAQWYRDHVIVLWYL